MAKLGAGAILVWLCVILAGGIGWIMNICKIVGSLHDPITGFFIARIAGVFAFPLGAILGYFS